MKMRKLLAGGAVAGALTVAAAGAGVAPANADPDGRGGDRDEWVDRDWRDYQREQRTLERDYERDIRGNERDWDRWWRDNRWRNDDRPPWGWGPPPPLHWRGHPPVVVDYWGYPVNPIWDPGFAAWGFWLFGVFIPVVVI